MVKCLNEWTATPASTKPPSLFDCRSSHEFPRHDYCRPYYDSSRIRAAARGWITHQDNHSLHRSPEHHRSGLFVFTDFLPPMKTLSAPAFSLADIAAARRRLAT